MAKVLSKKEKSQLRKGMGQGAGLMGGVCLSLRSQPLPHDFAVSLQLTIKHLGFISHSPTLTDGRRTNLIFVFPITFSHTLQ